MELLKIVTDEELMTLFSNVRDLCLFHDSRILLPLQQLLANWTPATKIGQVFLNLVRRGTMVVEGGRAKQTLFMHAYTIHSSLIRPLLCPCIKCIAATLIRARLCSLLWLQRNPTSRYSFNCDAEKAPTLLLGTYTYLSFRELNP